MLRTTLIILFTVVPALSQNLAKSGHRKAPQTFSSSVRRTFGSQPRLPPASAFAPAFAGSYSAKVVERSQQDRHTTGSQPRLPPARAFAPAYAGSYGATLMDRPQESSRTLPDQYYDARAIAPGLKEKLAQSAVEKAFAARAPVYSETDTSGGASGFASAYASAYAPAFFGSAEGSKKTVSAPASSWSATASGPAPTPAYAPQPRRGTYSGAASGGASGFAPQFAPLYAPEFFGSPKGATDYAPQKVAERPRTDSTGASGGSAGFTPTYASAYAPAFGSQTSSANEAHAYQTASAPAASAYSPQYSEPSSSGASGFAPLFAPAYAPAFSGGSGRTEGGSAPLLRDILQSPTSTFSAPAPSFASRGRQGGATSPQKEASGFAPLFGAAYAPAFGARKMMNLDTAETSPDVEVTPALTLMGLSIGFGGVIFAVKRFHCRASTSTWEPLAV